MRLILLFVFVPLIELFLLLKLAEVISGGMTFLLVVVTGVIGAALARRQGWLTIAKLQDEVRQGRVPTTTMADGLMIFVAGALLITPGILTDVFGFSLLIPFCRAAYRRWLVSWFKRHAIVETRFSTTSTAPRDQIVDSYVVEDRTRSDDAADSQR